MTSGESNF